MRIDWQMYEDGELGPEAEEALRNDPSARAELEGLRAFKRAVREAALTEPVPVRSMEEKLGSLVGRRPTTRWQVRAAAAIAALLLMGLVYGGASVLMWANPAIEQRAGFNTLPTAIDWAVDRSDIPVPQFTETGVGTFTSAHAARGWACFDFLVNGKTAHVLVTRGKVIKFGNPPASNMEGEVYVRSDTGVARFNTRRLLFVVEGGDRATNVAVSHAILRQLSN